MKEETNIGVKYTGPWGDYSGMGEANRNYVMALDKVGVDVLPERTIHVKDIADYGRGFKRCYDLSKKSPDYLVKIIHTTPDLILQHIEPLKYHIGHFFWETDKIPTAWAWYLNLMNEVWTGSELGKENLKKSGVRAPIFVFPEAVDTEIGEPKKYERLKRSKDYLFYSIFDWTERKNPKALLQAYWKEFEKNQSVTLLLKTYYQGFNRAGAEYIKKTIRQWKEELDQDIYPRVLLCTDLLSKEEVIRLHATGDCFVSAHRGEGWGIPQTEAMLFKNPVISTGYGGIHEWLTNEQMFLVKWKIIPVFNMENAKHYEPDQHWADIDISDLREKMRFVFENRQKAYHIAQKATNFVNKTFCYETVGNMMKTRLEEIYSQYTE